ncbi:hypothetical protein K438DRAFT_1606151, partial [Mycena galopus ATCC 62051]
VEHGVHENSPLIHQPVSGLIEIVRRYSERARGVRLMKLNDTVTIGRKMATIDAYKELTMAVASDDMAQVSHVLQAGLNNGAGVHGLIGLLRRGVGAAHGAAAISIGLLFLRLGGSRVAEIAHRTLRLPSVSMLRRHTTIRPLIPSPGMPTVAEIEANIDAAREAMPSTASPFRMIHGSMMLDEMATERRARYDDRNNKIIGICRQHVHKLPNDLNSEADMSVLCDGLKAGDAHLAGEATVAALGAFTSDPREYSARPVLFSSDCKLESGAEHARNILRPLMTAIKNKSEHGNTKFRIVCVASDGEARRGTAFTMEYMKQELSRDSLIFPHVGSLEFMNLLVGDDDVTPDKDFKHAFKCLHSLTMRDTGIEILGVHISVATLRQHLLASGLTLKQVNSFLNPNDKQDVPLSYRLLRAIWSLPPAPDSSPPLFVQARDALRIFGKLVYNLVMPYISLDMDLSTQLIHLSTAAHLLLDLYLHNGAHGRFMPTQTFV